MIFETPALLDELRIVTPAALEDERGYFMECFRNDLLEENVGYKLHFCQENQSFSKKGVIRGLHYQLPPFAQSKLVRVVSGEIWDVAVDVRKDSPNFGKYFGITLSAENQKQLFIPRGFAHGFMAITDAIVMYHVDNYYHKPSERSIASNAHDLIISWPLPVEECILSEKDRQHPPLSKATVFDSNSLYD